MVKRLSLVCLLAVFLLPSARAIERHVSTSGLDSNPGTFAQPWRTIQKAASVAVAGDTVFIRGNGGVYAERVTLSGRDGTLAAPIVFTTYAGDPMAVIDQSGVSPPDGLSALLTLRNSDFVTIRNLEFRNFKTAGSAVQQRAQTPVGILVAGDGNGIAITGCKVHDIWQSSPTLNNFDANGFGILVYGDSATAINGLLLDGNEVHSLRTGASESIVLNGNVTGFKVTRNTVHDCNNIGIDFIGFEGTNPNATLDQARDGLCSENVVFNIDSKFNPAYGGNFTTGGADSTRSAPGLYVDGGRDILIERNHVHSCNFAVSVGSEHQNKVVARVTVRNNLLHHCHVGGIVIGGSGTTNGGASDCVITNNTLVDNDTTGSGGGQISIQNYVAGTRIQRNLMVATAAFAQLVLKANTTGSFASGAIDWNYYKVRSGGDYEFIWNNAAQSTFAGWKSVSVTSKDSHSALVTSTVGLVNESATSASPASDFSLTATSPVRDIGDSAEQPFTPAAGEKDFSGQGRIANGRVDIGADEFMTPWQGWRDTWFVLPDGGSGAEALDDPDHDGVGNLLEYSQGGDPGRSDSSRWPKASINGAALRFSYLKSAVEFTYSVERSSTLSGQWTAVTNNEQTDGLGTYWKDIPRSGSKEFFRLRVAQP